MKSAFALMLLSLMLVLTGACSGESSSTTTPTSTSIPTPAPTPTLPPTPTSVLTPTPGPIAYTSYENHEIGVSIMYPDGWTPITSDVPEEWLTLVNDEGLPRLTLLTMFDAPDTPLKDRLKQAIETLAPEGSQARVELHGPVTLADGSAAERAEVTYADEEDVRLVQVAHRGGLTFVLTLSAPATEMELQQEAFNTALASFTSFPPAPYGIPRARALTMPLGEPSTLDPAIARETTSHLYVNNIFSGLVRFGPNFTVEPDLAQRWGVDEAGVVYIFMLRDDITFHDGRPITAHDFKYSIERATDPALHSDTAPLHQRYRGRT